MEDTFKIDYDSYLNQLLLFLDNQSHNEFDFNIGYVRRNRLLSINNLSDFDMRFEIGNKNMASLPPNTVTNIDIDLMGITYMSSNIKCIVPSTEFDTLSAYYLGLEAFETDKDRIITNDMIYKFLIQNPGICETAPNKTNSDISRDNPPCIYAPFDDDEYYNYREHTDNINTPFVDIIFEVIPCPDGKVGCNVCHRKKTKTITLEQKKLRSQFNDIKLDYDTYVNRWQEYYDDMMLESYKKYFATNILYRMVDEKIHLPTWGTVSKISCILKSKDLTLEETRHSIDNNTTWRNHKIVGGMII